MNTAPDELDTLLTDVRKTIIDNQLFLEKLLDEAIEVDLEDEPGAAPSEEDFEEL